MLWNENEGYQVKVAELESELQTIKTNSSGQKSDHEKILYLILGHLELPGYSNTLEEVNMYA